MPVSQLPKRFVEGLPNVLSVVTSDGVMIQSGDALYLRGDATTDGSVRASSPSDNVVVFETRVSGSWVNIGTFSN